MQNTLNIIIIVLLLPICMYSCRDYPPHDPNELPTRTMLIRICITIQTVAEETIDPVPTDIKELIKWINNSSIRSLEERVIGEFGAKVDEDKGIIYDVWGNPIKLVVSSPTEYTLISFGSNGRDDSGKFDDCVYSFDPLKFRK